MFMWICGAGMLHVQSIVAGVVGRAILAEQCGWFRVLQPKPLKTLGETTSDNSHM